MEENMEFRYPVTLIPAEASFMGWRKIGEQKNENQAKLLR